MFEPNRVAAFRERVWDFYREQGRDLPWRRNLDPYGIFISEVMLQQTQVNRVIGYWERWIEQFPNFETLARAELSDILAVWQGLGYNRRALWLKRAAELVTRALGGKLPDDPAELMKLPGIGPNTAGSIAAFAFNRPTVFVETNIRRVMIHDWFADQEAVAEAAIRAAVAATLDRETPREWYWALMDYGSALVKTVPNPNRRAKSYERQSEFKGSVRQLRGAVLRWLGEAEMPLRELQQRAQDPRLEAVLGALQAEGFISRTGDNFQIK